MTRRRVGFFQLAGAFVGSMIGAGFASGQEHLQFFVAFGGRGYWGIALAGLLLTFFGGLILRTAHTYRTRSHLELLSAVSDRPFTWIFDLILCTAMLISVSVMMAGGGALLSDAFQIPSFAGALILGCAAGVVVALGLDRMLKVNGVLALGLVLLIAYVAVRSLLLGGTGAAGPVGGFADPAGSGATWVPESWFLAAFLYASYNMTFSFSLFGALGEDVASRRNAWVGGIAGGVVLTFLCSAVSLAVVSTGLSAVAGELPMVRAAAQFGTFLGGTYVAAIWLAMLTSAITGIYTLVRRLTGRVGLSQGLLAASVVAVAFPLSIIGFKDLVATAYPLIGYAGAGCLIATVLHWMKRG